MTETITLEETLERHNNAHPDSQLEDITDALEAAKTRRLLELLRRRNPNAHWLDGFEAQFTDSTPKENYMILSLCAGVVLSHPRAYGVTWEQIKQAFDTKQGSPNVNQFLKREGRASRLTDYLMMAGCVKRGEC